jgi:hypothetical protein
MQHNLTAVTPNVLPQNRKYVADFSNAYLPDNQLIFLCVQHIFLDASTGAKRYLFLAFPSEQQKQQYLTRQAASKAVPVERALVEKTIGPDFQVAVGGAGDCFVCIKPMDPATLYVQQTFLITEILGEDDDS